MELASIIVLRENMRDTIFYLFIVFGITPGYNKDPVQSLFSHVIPGNAQGLYIVPGFKSGLAYTRKISYPCMWPNGRF